MLFKRVFIVGFFFMWSVFPSFAADVADLPLHVVKIADNAVRVWSCDHVSTTAVSAIATRKGIVVIDATENPILDRYYRAAIAKEFGRSDFRYLINTHGHSDHTAGNSVYSDCEIIAHEKTARMIQNYFSTIDRAAGWSKENISRFKKEIESGSLSESQKAESRERLIMAELNLQFQETSPKPVLPSKTFTDSMTLDCGDVTFELFQAGGVHTQSDIFIFVPQMGLLFTGDVMADKWLIDSPGCLAAFIVGAGEADDYPVLLKNWQALLDRKNQIKQYIPGHWNGELSAQGFEERFQYVKTLIDEVKKFAGVQGDLNAFIGQNSLKNKYPHLIKSPGLSPMNHQASIYRLYSVYTGKISLLDSVRRLIMHDRFNTDFDSLKSEVLNASGKYFYIESDLNSLGYFLLNQNLPDFAIPILEFNTQLFPSSWNVYDSLAEAYYKKGDKEKALNFYRKSLDINPANENGKKFIDQILKEKSY